MPLPWNAVTCHAFTEAELVEQVREGARSPRSDPPVPQLLYLARYAKQLGALTLAVEHHYIDRHFIEEFSLYYARNLAPPPNSCRRIHLFRRALTQSDLDEAVNATLSSEEKKRDVEASLSESYLGFIVVRPLPDVPIGRTVLRALDDEPRRKILATASQKVHLMGLELRVEGLAFLQQDRAVGACATAAVWMAMSRAARLDGVRAPTPAFLAEAAARHSVGEGRGIPSGGLSIAQIADSIRECGFAPELLKVTHRPEAFVASIYPYLRSGIPVVLVLEGGEGAHAVTAVGYKIGAHRPELEFLFPLRSSRMEKIYVHDDRIGPYARADMRILTLEPNAGHEEEVSYSGLFLEIEEKEGPLPVTLAFVPVYPKLRISPDHLWPMVTRMSDYMVEGLLGPKAYCEVFFARAGSYLDECVRLCGEFGDQIMLPRDRLARFLRSCTLSRWVCITRWWSADDVPAADLLFDTTDIVREPNRSETLLLGAVGFNDQVRPHLDVLGKRLQVPAL